MPLYVRYLGLLLLLCLPASAALSAQVYKYVDDNGNVTYSEIPPTGQEGVETVTVDPAVAPERLESAQERMQRMQALSSELAEARKGREEARAEQLERQRPPAPQMVDYGYRGSDRYPYFYAPWYFWPRPHLVGPRRPGFRHPGLKPRPPIERPRHPGLKPRPPIARPRHPGQWPRQGIGRPRHPGPALESRPAAERPRPPGLRQRGAVGRSGIEQPRPARTR